MGVLSDIFNGPDGVDKLLHDTLGGTAIITYQGEHEYDDATEQWVVNSLDKAVTVAFIPLPFEQLNENVKKLFLEENISLAGTIPTCDLTIMPTPNQDTITHKGVTYIIEKITSDNVENGSDHVTIYGKL